MGAEGFVTQAGHFTDRTVVTYDPRGAGRSKRTDGASETTVEEQADDLHRLIDALGAGPVDIFASSGGAVNALALVARHPEQVRILVAHEPPAAQELPDREQVLAACQGIKDAYLREGFGPAMAKFIALVSYQGPIPAGFADQPGPDPATFGLPTVDDGSRDDALLCLNMPSCPGHRHDFDALRAASTRIIMAVRSAVQPGHGRPGGRSGGRTARNRSPSPSPAATTDSSAANTAAWASRTPSPPPCARSSPTDGLIGGCLLEALPPRPRACKG